MKKLLFLILVVGVVAVIGRTMVNTTAPDADGKRGSGSTTSSSRSQNDVADRDFISSVVADAEAEGTVYHVRPTRAGRLADRGELDIAWTQAVARGVPDQAGLRQQFLCHPLSVVARAKPTWDLESWRPAVGGIQTMLAACNPR